MSPLSIPGAEPPKGERLQKFLSAAGVASRRHAEEMIRTGRVTVNDEPAHVGMRVSDEDIVRVDGLQVGAQAPAYLLLNKPLQVVTTLDDPQGRRTVAEFVPADGPRLYPVGRLDYETSGLLLLTNDGELAHRLMHPSYSVPKEYLTMVEGRISARSLRQLAEGIELDDGMTHPATVSLIQAGADRSLVRLTISEGRNRQVRRMFAAVGHDVRELTRTGYGPLGLGDLKRGEARALTAQEIRRLFKLVGMNRPRTRASASGKQQDERRTDGGAGKQQKQGGAAGKQARGKRSSR